MSGWRWRLLRQIAVRGQSMEPTHRDGARLWVWRFAHLFRPPRRGEIVAFRSPADPARVDLKRVIGLPLEEVSWYQDRFAINDEPLDEPYARIPAPTPGDEEIQRCRLGARCYFVAGDNRLYSQDSRQYGSVPRSAILGKVSKSV